MNFGEFIKNLRNENNLSQRDLALKSGVSNAEISRIETGERQKPSPMALKAFAPHLGKTYEELLKQAGYIEEVIDHEGYLENIYRDDKGHLVDIVRRAKDMYEKDSKWANLAYRVTAANLSDSERNIIKAQTEALLEQFIKNKEK
ncbi:helix-turn-helix domain-containing protein [Clostridium sp. CS001]|uniref:helix-turn-helix domain-containing protein n=1 Tax=Clostridium sp. CS001 TaxID=2880648 RepID=UPI001CF28489|nr:helix-turn-helix transcriptional regulator [Clostridium sp. CS001]MCB2291435.1 helix-turn-helix domain-containing protein [Clostridium sp. CS001]